MIFEYTPEKIVSLKPNEIFVFGSNAEGRHGKGAALDALKYFGAVYGQPDGLQMPAHKFEGRMVYAYGKQKRDDIKSINTIDAVECGERKATTRFYYDGHIDYWASVNIGDIIKWVGEHKNVLVKVTKPLTKLDENIDAETWSKLEGWNVEYFYKNIKPRISLAYQMEFEVLPQSYAIITKKDFRKEKSSSIEEIKNGIIKMFLFADKNPHKKLLVTKIGSSLAGYTVDEIKNIFEELKNKIPDNVVLPIEYEVRD